MDYKKLALSVHDAQNRVRTNPQSFVPKLEAMLKYFEGTLYRKPGAIPLRTNEGPSAVKECIDFLKKAAPVSAFTLNDGMGQACQDHVNDIGPRGQVSHSGSDGSSFSKRLERYGDWSGTVGENCEFGSDTGEDVIISLLVDDGVLSRGHRVNIFSPEFKVVGIACGYHKAYDHCTVLDYAAGYGPKGSKSKNTNQYSSNFSMPTNNYPSNNYTTQTTTYPSYSNYATNGNPTMQYNSFSSQPFGTSSFSGFDPFKDGNSTKTTYTNYDPVNNSSTKTTYTSYDPYGGSSTKTTYTNSEPFNNSKTTYSTRPDGTHITKYSSKYGDSNILNDPLISQHLGKAKADAGFSSNNLREMAQKEAPPGAIGWSTNSNISITNGKKVSKITTTYKFADGSTKDVVKEITENM